MIPLLRTVTVSKRSQMTGCPLWRRQTRDPLRSPSDFWKGTTYTIHLLVSNALKLLFSPDRPRTLNSLQSRHCPCKNLHPRLVQTHLSQPPSTHCPLDSRCLRSLLLHRPILRAIDPMSTDSSCLGSHRSRFDVYPRKHDVYCHWLFQCLH